MESVNWLVRTNTLNVEKRYATNVLRNILTCSSNYYCHGSVTMRPLRIVDVHMSMSTVQKILKALPWKHNNAFSVLLCYIYLFQQYETRLELCVKCSILLSDFNQTWIFLGRFSLKSPKSNFIEIRPVKAALIHTGRWTYTTKLTGTFRDLHEGASKHHCSQTGWTTLSV
jgi:hypothetical protein